MSEQRPPPQTTIQAAGQAATDVIGGLRQQPMLLGLVVLNVIGLAAGVWFLMELLRHSDKRWKQQTEEMQLILRSCLPGEKRG